MIDHHELHAEHRPLGRDPLRGLSRHSVYTLSLCHYAAMIGPGNETKRQGRDSVNRFEQFSTHFPVASEPGLLLAQIQQIAFSTGKAMADGYRDAKAQRQSVSQRYEEQLFGTSVTAPLQFGLARFVVRTLGLLGASYFLFKLAIDITAIHAGQNEPAAEAVSSWLPFGLACAIPVLVGVFGSFARAYRLTNLTYQRDCELLAIEKTLLTRHKNALACADARATELWQRYEKLAATDTWSPTGELLIRLHSSHPQPRIHSQPPHRVAWRMIRRKWPWQKRLRRKMKTQKLAL